MGVKVNESGAIKNLALDTDDVETIKAVFNMPVLYLSSSSVTFKPSEFGITNSHLATSYNLLNSKKCPLLCYYQIPDTCKSIIYSGEFNFTVPVPCKFSTVSSSASTTYSIINVNSFPNRYINQGTSSPNYTGVSAALPQYQTYLGTGSSDTWYATAYIFLGLIIEDDGRHYRIEAILVRSDQITAAKALSANYGYVGTSAFTGSKTMYFEGFNANSSYFIEKTPYSLIEHTTDTLISK